MLVMAMEPVKIRRVQETDASFLWTLANDPEVRAASFSTNSIPWEDNLKWLRAQLSNPSCIFFIINKDSIPIGQVRFDKTNEEEAIMSISIKKEYRGKGLAAQIISVSIREIFLTTDINRVHAYVKEDNNPSISAFLKANFKDCGEVVIKGNRSIHLMKESVANGSFN
jgi:UDP-2,4-diacetamido-2,4,6-trideoxy-beta-L-altropyranose hydrolase